MQHRTLLKLAASTLVLGVTMVGCKPASEGSRPLSASQSGTGPERQAGQAADAAMAAVQNGNLSEAVAQAESAVALSPRDAGFRTTLGDIYIKAGRFQSAAAAYSDALQLNPGDARATLSLALSQIALGRSSDALQTLGRDSADLAPADHGLALALAGDKEGAIRLLGAAAREPEATGRVRQNLALAYALAGDWTQSRAIAAQDVSPDELDERMAKWAEFAQPRSSYDQVATLLGVSPATDSGLPVRLALNPEPAQPVQVAAAEPAETYQAPEYQAPVETEAAPVAYAEAAPVQAVPEEAARVEAVPAEAAPVLAAAVVSVESVLPRQIAKPLARTLRAAATVRVAFKGRYVVQLGAFASARSVERAWNGAVGRLDRLANYIPASTRIDAGKGVSLTRLSVGGFAQRQTADKLCNSLRRVGGTCFVRATAGDAPVRWASRNARNG